MRTPDHSQKPHDRPTASDSSHKSSPETSSGSGHKNNPKTASGNSFLKTCQRFIDEHRVAALVAGVCLLAAVLGAAVSLYARFQAGQVDYITAVYTGDTKEGVVLDSANPGFTVTAHFHNGEENAVTGWEVVSPVTLEEAKVSTVIITYQKASTQVQVQCTTGLIESITAEYDGDTEAGTKLTDTNEGIHVFAIRGGGKKEELQSGWRVVNPAILEADKISRVQIEYREFSCVLSVQCTTRGITKITAVYTGSTEEGTVIGTGCEDLTVTAQYTGGESAEVTGWTLAKEVQLAPRERYTLEIHYRDRICTAEVTCTTPTREEYMESCNEVGYYAMSHNPAHYAGMDVRISGTIEELRRVEDGSVNVILAVSGDIFGFTTRTVCAVYSSTLHGDLPDVGSYVTVYGSFLGVSEVNTEKGTKTVPLIDAEYVAK